MAGTFSGVTLSMKSSPTRIGVANPHAPRHSTSITVNRPSGLVAPSSPQPVSRSSASTTASAPQMLQGLVVQMEKEAIKLVQAMEGQTLGAGGPVR